ncbi:hypothetical protein [Brevibacterium gallinarum]|uniref:Uncharacterized protein n=1 Tax=Brevibacterium gallinarum TaxID=2762220 RepID=A0ABR8WQT2_9MICO|nr:hypothetical protein [Brevibacterium gallinarum]MBD8019350.1 hypothetical protein [Brevibacterium gallinarum]
MTARMIVRHGDREWYWQSEDDMLIFAIDRAFRYRLTAGDTVYFSAVGAPVSGRSAATLIIPPSAYVSFSYTNLDGSEIDAVMARVAELVDRDGGVTLDHEDKLVDDGR